MKRLIQNQDFATKARRLEEKNVNIKSLWLSAPVANSNK